MFSEPDSRSLKCLVAYTITISDMDRFMASDS